MRGGHRVGFGVDHRHTTEPVERADDRSLRPWAEGLRREREGTWGDPIDGPLALAVHSVSFSPVYPSSGNDLHERAGGTAG